MNGTLHHIEINVSDLNRSRLFYEWLLPQLGYQLHQQWPEGFSYALGETYLVFIQTQAKHLDIAYHRARTGLNHLAFHADKAMIDKISSDLALKGIPILYPRRHPYAAGKDSFALFFEDPDRIKIELADY